jgi:hypothetical protein
MSVRFCPILHLRYFQQLRSLQARPRDSRLAVRAAAGRGRVNSDERQLGIMNKEPACRTPQVLTLKHPSPASLALLGPSNTGDKLRSGARVRT